MEGDTIHRGKGELVTDGIYRFVRHPQYSGFMVIILGFLIQWPTIITLIMAPVLIIMYIRLSKKEENKILEEFGEEYLLYMNQVPRFIPSFRK